MKRYQSRTIFKFQHKYATNLQYTYKLPATKHVYGTQIVKHLNVDSLPRAGIMSIIRDNIGSAQSAGYWLLGAVLGHGQIKNDIEIVLIQE